MEKFWGKIIFCCCLLSLLCLPSLLRSPIALADSPAAAENGQDSAPIVLSNVRPESSLTCGTHPPLDRESRTPKDTRPEDFSPDRFRQGLANDLRNPPRQNSDRYSPPERIAPANPTNYGDRYLFDIYGYSAYHRPLIVFHETVATVNNTVDFFQTPHPDEDDQTSYHTLIGLDGEVIYLVPPDKRAFGAGNSVFTIENREETVKTNPDYPPSVNDFAYHISLESPEDGLDSEPTHSGYTEAQYRSLAWLVARTGIAPRRFTTHRSIDRSGQRIDPRSFDFDHFLALSQTMPQIREIYVGCKLP